MASRPAMRFPEFSIPSTVGMIFSRNVFRNGASESKQYENKHLQHPYAQKLCGGAQYLKMAA